MSLYASVCSHFLEPASPWHPYDQEDPARPFCTGCLEWMKYQRVTGMKKCLDQLTKLTIAPQQRHRKERSEIAPPQQHVKECSDDTVMLSDGSEMSGVELRQQQRGSDISMTQESVDGTAETETSPISVTPSDNADWNWFVRRESTALKAKVCMDESKRMETRKVLTNHKLHAAPRPMRLEAVDDHPTASKIVRNRVFAAKDQRTSPTKSWNRIQARHRHKSTCPKPSRAASQRAGGTYFGSSGWLRLSEAMEE